MNKKITSTIFFLVLFLWMSAIIPAYANSRIHSLYNNDFIKIEQMDGVSYEVLEETKQNLNAAQQYFRMHFQIALNNSVLIVLTPNKSTYRDEIMTRLRYDQSRAEELANNTAGLAGGHIIIVNAGSSSTIEGRSTIIIHELTHIYQRQLAGGRSGAVMWILEGIANTVAAQVVDQQGYYRLDTYKRNLQRTLRIADRKPSLDELIARNDWSACLYKYGYHITYQTASYATLLLTERFGERRVMNYFIDLGRGANAERAFQDAFGISLANFAGYYAQELR